MLFIHNIQSVSKYESKILLRSWFFKVFTVLAIGILGFLNFTFLVSEQSTWMWIIRAVPSNIPYMNLLLLNTGQAVIAIFLSSEFLKRDKKLDTSEVFYVRPLSNAEYVIGKIWGNLKVFLVLNIIVIIIAVVFNCIAKSTSVDWTAYIVYFFLISIPTLVFIIGLSIFLMLVLKNQALTFILLLGYIGLTVFYIEDKFYYVFDYMAYSLPLFKSSIVGFTNLDIIFTHRGIYFFFGLGFIFFTIFLFRRLPNSSRSHYPWLVLSACMFILGGSCAYKHINRTLVADDLRAEYIALNNKYVHTPKIVVDNYSISLTQEPNAISSEVEMKGIALETSNQFTFCLNPGLQVQNVTQNGNELKYIRDKQILLVDFGKSISKGDTVQLTIRYKGKIDESLCYLDIEQEILSKKYQSFLFNIDKRYAFQTPDYLLVTPENYWYPRPGTSYSDESPDWQQTYFSQFVLKVKPLPGLLPISQGESKEENGLYTFTSDAPYQSISLVIGNYKQKSVKAADSILYSICYIDGHDFFSAPYDTLADTIPTLIKDFKENIERNYKLSYPFKRFSIVESPGQHFSYARTWSQAQEMVQPEMVLFAEKGLKFDEANIKERQEKEKEWSKWSGREIGMDEALIRATQNFFWIFGRQEGTFNFSSGSRGQGNISSEANPYFIFPELYNFRYNIYSPEWPIANRLIELYLQKKGDNYDWERQINGISNNEKASLLMEKHNFKELLADVEQRNIADNIIGLKAFNLFAHAELNAGVLPFRDSLYTLLERNTFRNIQFESMLDTLGALSDSDLRSHLPEWNHPTPLPLYTIGLPEVIQAINRDEEVYQLDLLFSNNSDHDGIIDIDISVAGQRRDEPDPRTQRKITIPANQTKRVITHWEDAPRNIKINTLISGNLPSIIRQPIQNIRKERNYHLQEEGEYIVPNTSFDIPNEIIVDNEDSTLFVLSEPEVVGMLPKWLDKVADSGFKYAGVSWWRAPIQWTATTNAGYYGKFVRSAYVIKSGNGSQTATWKVPLLGTGQYEVYYYVYRNDEIRWQRGGNAVECHFKIKYDKETEDAYINLRKAEDGWQQLGVYFFDTDTVEVVLTNECKIRSVSADAVKFVKR